MWYAWERREWCTGFEWENPKKKRPLRRPRCRWEDGIRERLAGRVWIGFDLLRIGTSGKLL
jgi:hypothetical protein